MTLIGKVKINSDELTKGSSYILKGLKNYNQWMANQINRLGPISGTVLEFGCGSGGLTKALSELPGVARVIANDISPHVKTLFLTENSNPGKIRFIDENILETPEIFAGLKYDWAVSSNTLEHIEDDERALRSIVEYASLKTAIILVPALDCLYGTCDLDGGHFRRYTKARFRRLAKDAGLELEEMFYFNMPGIIGWWTKYVLLKERDYESKSHTSSYSIFDRYIIPLYSRIERNISCPFGLSLVARVTKK